MSGLFACVQIGWESFSSLAKDVWMDDVVVSTARVGCN
jgi:hypothetical protein